MQSLRNCPRCGASFVFTGTPKDGEEIICGDCIAKENAATPVPTPAKKTPAKKGAAKKGAIKNAGTART